MVLNVLHISCMQQDSVIWKGIKCIKQLRKAYSVPTDSGDDDSELVSMY